MSGRKWFSFAYWFVMAILVGFVLSYTEFLSREEFVGYISGVSTTLVVVFLSWDPVPWWQKKQ